MIRSRAITTLAFLFTLTGCERERATIYYAPKPTQDQAATTPPPPDTNYTNAEKLWIADCVRDGMRGDNTHNALDLCLKYATEMRGAGILSR